VSAVVRRTTAKSRKATGRPAARVAKRPASRASGEVTTHSRVGEANADRRDLVIARRPHAVLMLNKYPYASAHLMVAVKRHAAQFRDLSPAEREDLHELTAVAEHLLEVEYAPHGVNYGLNVGKVAGAGFPGHMHLHLVPRWNGDTNFMPAVAQTRVLPEALEVTWSRLRRALATLERGARPKATARKRGRRG